MTPEHSSAVLRVLLVEDSVYDRDAFRRALNKSALGVELITCVRAEDALQRLEDDPLPCDLIVSDHNLPGMSGLDLCREIIRRQIPLPTVLLTGGGSEHLAVEALKSGVHDYLIKDPEGGYLKLLPIVLPEVVKHYREHSLRQQAEKALRASEELFRHAFEYTAVGMAMMSVGGRFLRVNRAWCEMLGYSQGRLLELAVHDITHPEDLAANLEAIQRVIEGKQPFIRMEKRYLNRQGQVVWGYLSATLIRNDSGQPLHFISQLQDITGRKQVEQELRQERAMLAERVHERTEELSRANAELARAVRLKDEFLAIMSHELRTPLNIVLGMSSALLEKGFGDLTDRQSQALQRIEESGQHLLNLITDILDLSEIGAGKWQLRCHGFAVEPVCQAVLRLFQETIRQKHLNISLQFDSRAANMYADERRIKQVLVHLLSNAVKFTPVGGEIGMVTRISADDNALSFTVWDTGIGMSREGMERLFLPFTQADSSLSRRYAGAGVGLSLVYHIVQMHGGSLLVESSENTGSRFTTFFPWQSERTPATGGNDSEIFQPGALYHEAQVDLNGPIGEREVMPVEGERLVLLSDGHESTLAQLSAYFMRKGWCALTARNGQEILSRMAEAIPHLIIVGGHLPHTDTENLIAQIRRQGPALPLAMLATLELPGDRERYLKAGATAYFRKPLNKNFLDSLVRESI